MDLSCRWNGEVASLRAAGDLDAGAAPHLLDVVDDALAHGCRDVDLDLTDVGFLDCAGVGALRAVQDHVVGLGGSLACVCPEGQPRCLIRLLGAECWLLTRPRPSDQAPATSAERPADVAEATSRTAATTASGCVSGTM